MEDKRCTIPTAPDGEMSTLYVNLQTLCNKDHALANYVYATYSALNLAEEMDNAGYKRNKNGEHSAKDVYEFLNIKQIQTESKLDSTVAAKKAGAMDNQGRYIDYVSAKDAIEKAVAFNETSKGKVAYVVQNGDKFGIVIDNLDARTQYQRLLMEQDLKLWTQFSDTLTNEGVNMSELENINLTANALSIQEFIKYINSIATMNIKFLTMQDIKTLIVLNPNHQLIQNALNRWGTMDNVLENIKEQVYSNNPSSFVTNILQSLQKGQIVSQIISQLQRELEEQEKIIIAGRKEKSIKEELDRLNREFGIGLNNIIIESKAITKLSEAMSNAIVALQRQLRFLTEKYGRNQQGLDIENNMQTLVDELQGKRYCEGLLQFFNDALSYAQRINDQLDNIPDSRNTLDQIREMSHIIVNAQNAYQSYYNIAKSVADINTVGLVIDQNVTDEDKKTLEETAGKVRIILDQQQMRLQNIQTSLMMDIVNYIIGDKSYNGFDAANLVSMVTEDSSYLDFLYSWSRVSNPLIAVMGTVVRNAQVKRQEKMNEISLRIRRATHKLRQSGNSDTSFMFLNLANTVEEKDRMYNQYYRIISEEGIDWALFNKNKNITKYRYEQQGLNGFALKQAMENWEENNTELKLVDKVNNRYERIPNRTYHNPLIKAATWDRLTEAQKEYYNEMMQIKGELGTMLPIYAQDQYRPVQLRGEILDILKEGIRGKVSAKEIAKTVLDRMNFFKIRKDDEFFSRNGEIVSGELYGITYSDIHNNILRRIPIYYFNKVNQEELLQNFSSGMSRLAGTATNYQCLNEVKELVETMQSFINSQEIDVNFKGYGKMIDKMRFEDFQILSHIYKSNIFSKNAVIVQGFISKFFYNDVSKNKPTTLNILIRNLVSYNSLKSLAINVKGGFANWLVGEYQIIIKAVGGTIAKGIKAKPEFTLADYAKAKAVLFGDLTLKTPGKIMDFFTNNQNSKDTLLINLFDPMVDDYGTESHRDYHSNPFRIMFGGFNSYGLYASGEYLIHITTMYAKLFNTKVYNSKGKKVSLYSVLNKGEKIEGNREIVIEEGATIDGENPITMDYLREVKNKIRAMNQNMHGSMAQEDKGIINNYTLGHLVMNFRQWMVESYSRRYRGMHWDGTENDYKEGYLTSMFKLMMGLGKDYWKFARNVGVKWKDMTDLQKTNVAEAMSAVSMFVALYLLNIYLGDVEDIDWDEDDGAVLYMKRLAFYGFKRLVLEETAFTPIGVITTSKTMINSPIPSINTVNGLLYPLVGLVNGDINKEMQSGHYAGENKYWVNFRKYTLPFWYQIEQIKRLDSDDDQFTLFDSGQRFR